MQHYVKSNKIRDIIIFTVGVVFTVYSTYRNERHVVCLKLSIETNFLRDRVIFARRIDLIK